MRELKPRGAKRNYNWLRRMDKELDTLCAEYDIEKDELKIILDEIFRDIRNCIDSKKMPSVVLKGFGRFSVTKSKLRRSLRGKIFDLRKMRDSGVDNLNYFLKLKKDVRQLWAINQRLIAEKRGIRTWLCWKRLNDDLEGHEKCHEARYDNCLKCRKNENLE